MLHGVELRNGGQYGPSTKSALQFVNLKSNSNVSSVKGSSFVNCHSECINVRYSHNISITNNVIFRARTFGMEVEGFVHSVVFSNNLISSILNPPLSNRLLACFVMKIYHYQSYLNVIEDNICQGSQGYGFILPHVGCYELSSHMSKNNVAGSCRTGFIFNDNRQSCQAFSHIGAYAC